ncbi:NupC/NupG family nucleoside CNT transporter [Stenotrophomonas maltophilia]|jgi:CNT family concentrative nucleoside transporter|uniref:Na+ dependent nucleoside transporter domain-containing protein n=1 Tax=Stenotrophomonas maltophilia TaxID=40324 RepID=A0AAP7GPX8_STEMA|nr:MULTISPECIES: nucleoside transporter C-terminal domain-containing protein [Stenotrophomonas]KOQ70869.1 Na+ dependent nucleoside transporter domain-containing protein [Stenotrophomonas maltophilia]MBA0221482.1 NupC/NupG family nucleoside CNT transporter [Stenotrophomonas maltophilia]MBE5270354.1 NupC/NupG family nucleoside CNT transporter [Stenotrophomonas sp. B2]MBH1592035.1 NupC/NupG family nucleoside CNT transporter [Stenotrophomonas maltophilia]MBH1664961.1 NupC/NupG family nucleoside CN
MVEGLGRIGFGLFGLAVLIGITWLFSNNKRAVDWKLVATGITLQIAFAALVILVPGGRDVFDALGHGFVKVLSFVNEGSKFIFGSLMDVQNYGFIFAFQVLPTIIFFSALMGVMYHLNVMQAIVRVMAWAITKVMRVSGAETTSVCASVFIGQTEAPLTVRPYIAKMTQSELLTMMIGGMAHIAGGVLAAYVGMLGGGDPTQQAFYAKHLLAASIMAAPATLVVAKLLIPETGTPLTRGTVKMEVEKTSSNIIDAAAAGAGDGLKLALNIGAMLLAFIALIALLNAPLTWLGEVTGLAAQIGKPTNLSTIFGYLLAPIAWVIGTPWADATTVGSLIGQKVVINEFVAYTELSQIVNGQVAGVTLSNEGRLIATYALCGFANFSSIAIQIGGIGGLAPERRHDLAKFGLRAVLGGTIATFMTATIAGVLTHFS